MRRSARNGSSSSSLSSSTTPKTRKSPCISTSSPTEGSTTVDESTFESNEGYTASPSYDHEDPAEKYIRNCARFELKVDTNVVIALRTKWNILKPTKKFDEGALLPLMGILDNDKTIKKVDLSYISMQDPRFAAAGNGNSNARVLASILKANDSIESLDLSNTGLDDDGVIELCDAIVQNKRIKDINLSGNYFGEAAAAALEKALKVNESVSSLDISRNALAFSSINSLLCSCVERGMKLKTDGNYVFEEILNSVTHGFGFIASLIGNVLLLTEAAQKSDYHFWPCLIYSITISFLFLSSTLFHSFFMLPAASRVLQVLDHVGIYLLIAGSYSPYLLIGLHSYMEARVLACGIWAVALGGCAFAAISDLNNPYVNAIECVIFLVMGFALLVIYDIFCTLQATSVRLLLCAGFVYSGGITFYVLGTYRPIYHVVWHICVLVATAIIWFDVYFTLLNTTPTGYLKEAMGIIDVAVNTAVKAATEGI